MSANVIVSPNVFPYYLHSLTPEKDNMIALEPLKDFLSLCVWTGAVKGERPASAIVIGAPGSGKTSILEMIQCEAAPFLSDLTAREISGLLREHKKATHILLADMMAIFGHRGPVVRLTCRAISSLTGESLLNDPFDGSKQDRTLGLITAIPSEDIEKNRLVRQNLMAGGFASRFMLVRFDYCRQTVAKIHEYIASDAYIDKVRTPFEIDGEKKPVLISAEFSRSIMNLALIAKGSDPIGTRIHHHLRALTKASARRCGRSEVAEEDVRLIQSYADFLSAQGRIL